MPRKSTTLLFLFVCSLSLGADPVSAPASAPAQNQDAGLLFAAAANQEITPPVGVPLAGYGSLRRRDLIPFSRYFHKYATYFQPSDGVLDPIRAKVLILKRGDQHLLFMSLDLVAVTAEFRSELTNLIADLGFKPEEVFVSGTHTHNGPGAISKNPFWSIVAVDAFKPQIYYPMLTSAADLVRRAYADLQPALLQAYQFRVDGLQVNRRQDHPPYVFDPNANVLVARTLLGDYLGALVNVAVHGTAMPVSNLHLSADVPGAMERHFESRLAARNSVGAAAPTVVFINGAEGDVAPAQEGVNAIPALGALFATQADAALDSNARFIWPTWEISHQNVDIGRARLRLGNCLGGPLLHFGLKINVSKYLVPQAPISVIKLGDMIMMTWPGEPTTALGLAMKDIATKAGAAQAWVLGLTNDHLSYFVTPNEWHDGGYESCSSFYGPHGGDKIVNGFRRMLTPN